MNGSGPRATAIRTLNSQVVRPEVRRIVRNLLATAGAGPLDADALADYRDIAAVLHAIGEIERDIISREKSGP